jgi:hypothetical protein
LLYLIFHEGYTATSGPALHRADLADETIRLTRVLDRLLTGDREVAGLLALMLLTDARRAPVPTAAWSRSPSRTGCVGMPVTSTRAWHSSADCWRTRPWVHYPLQAAIAAIHDEAPARGTPTGVRSSPCTGCSSAFSPGPMVTLNQAIAEGMVNGPHTGLDLLATLDADSRMTAHHRLDSTPAHLHAKRVLALTLDRGTGSCRIGEDELAARAASPRYQWRVCRAVPRGSATESMPRGLLPGACRSQGGRRGACRSAPVRLTSS